MINKVDKNVILRSTFERFATAIINILAQEYINESLVGDSLASVVF